MHIKREEYLNKLISYKNKDLVKVITGIRRCGKSVLLNEIFYDYLLSSGVDQSHIIKVGLESGQYFDVKDTKSLYSLIANQIKDDDCYYIFIDEIQNIDNFEDAVNALRVDFNCDIYITGSNSKLLSKDINTKMRGRSIEIKLFPLSFKEYFSFYGGDKKEVFNNYLLYGGLPYLLQEDNPQSKKEYLTMIGQTLIDKDIIEHYHIRNNSSFNAVLDFLYSNIGSYASASKIANTLTSSGNKISHDTVEDYLEYVTDAFLFYKAQRFDIKGKGYLKTLNKYYACDLGIRNSRLNYHQIEITHSLENVVYLELIRRGYTVDIGINGKKEIDFLIKSSDELYYVQVCYHLEDEAKKEQEISSFYGLDDGYKKILISMDDDPFTHLKNGYKMLNVFDFLLNNDALERI